MLKSIKYNKTFRAMGERTRSGVERVRGGGGEEWR